MRIKAGSGYYSLKCYPIGGAFRRAGENGIEVKKIRTRLDKPSHGCTVIAELQNGELIAINESLLEA